MEQESSNVEIREQAARWFAAQRRPLGVIGERETYRRWIENAQQRAELDRLQTIWTDLEQANPFENPLVEQARPRRGMLAVAGLAVIGFGVMGCMQGPFWTALDWATR